MSSEPMSRSKIGGSPGIDSLPWNLAISANCFGRHVAVRFLAVHRSFACRGDILSTGLLQDFLRVFDFF